MMHLSEILKILRNHTDIAYEQDGEIQSLVIRETEFYKIARAIIKVEEENNKANVQTVGALNKSTIGNNVK